VVRDAPLIKGYSFTKVDIMPTDLEQAKRDIKRARLLCRHIQEHMQRTHGIYKSSHPDFADLLVDAARYADGLDEFLEQIFGALVSM